MKKVLIGLLVVLALVVGGALVAPSFIDWNAYRAEIAGEVRKATGRDFAIDGPVDVAILPAPNLSVRKARLANLEGAKDPDMVRLDALDLRIAFWPLLSGKVVVQSVVLRGADIRLEKLADGRENWVFAKPGEAGGPQATSGAGGGGAPIGPARTAGDAISLEQVSIEGSRLSYRDSRTGKVQRIEGINARIAAGTLSGPYAARGVLRYGGLPLSFELQAGRFNPEASTNITLEAGFPEAEAKLRYSGYLTPGKPSFTLTGEVSASGPDLGALAATLARVAEVADQTDKNQAKGKSKPKPKSKTSKGPVHAFSVNASLSGGAESIALKDIRAEMNGTKATGAITIQPADVTHIDGKVAITRLDLDKWMAGEKPAAPAKPKSSKPGAQATKAGFALPPDLSVAMQVEIGNIVYRKGLIRDVQGSFALEKGALRIRTLSARLPGGTKASLTGRLKARKKAPSFAGKVALDSGDFRAVVRWLGGEDLTLPADRLRKARFQATLNYGPERLEVRDLDFHFDSSHLTGGVVLAMRKRIGIGARLKLDKFNINAYLPKTGAPSKAAKKEAGNAKAAAGLPGGLAALGSFDANFNLSAASLTYGGERITGVDMQGALVGGNLTLKELKAASVAGARLNAKGTVRDIDKTPVPDLTLSLTAKDPRRLFALADLTLPVRPDKLAPFSVTGRIKSETKAVTTDFKVNAGNIDVTAKGRIDGLDGFPSVDLDLGLGHPDFVDFVQLFDPDFRPERRVKGPLKLAAKVTSSGFDVKLKTLDARFGPSRLKGAASLSLAALPPVLKGDLEGDEIILDHFLPGPEKGDTGDKGSGQAGRDKAQAGGAPWSDEPIDASALRLLNADLQIRAKSIVWRRWRVVEPRLDVTLEDGKFAMRRLAGGMLGGSFHMSGGFTAPEKTGGPVEARFDLDVARMDLKQAMFNAADIDVVKGNVDFKMNLTGAGKSSRALAGSLAGSGALRASDGAVTGFDLKRVSDRLKNLRDGVSLLGLLQTAMAGGSTRFSRLSGTFDVKDGVLTSKDVAIDAEGGSGKGTLEVDIGRWLMDGQMQFRLEGNSEAPPFGLQMKGPLDNPRRIIKANELQAWLAQKAAGALVKEFMGQPKQSQPQQGTGQTQGTQEQPASPRDQFIKGIFDILKNKK